MNQSTEPPRSTEPLKITEPPRIKLKPAPVWELIGRRNMSQNELARRAEISSGYLSQLISGRKCPSPEVRQRLQAALEVERFEDIFVMEYGDD